MQEGINKRHTVEITTLTPISIGAGAVNDWVKGVDFIIDNHKLYKLNIKKMIAAGVDPDNLAEAFKQLNDKDIFKLISGKLKQVSDATYECPINYISNNVKSFIRNQLTGNPIIPGSSLKGAMRSVLLEYMMRSTDKNARPLQLEEKSYFGSSTAGDEFMRFIKIADAEFRKTRLLNSKIFNLYRDGYSWKGGWKHGGNRATTSEFDPIGFNTLYEVIGRGQKGYCDIMLSHDLYLKVVSEMPDSVINNNLTKQALDITALFNIINAHTRQHIDKEIRFYESYSNDKTPQIIDNLKGLSNYMTKDSCVIKMSAGSGFHSITGDWQFDDYSIDRIDNDRGRSRGMHGGRKTAKSRKIVIDGDQLMPMGFVQLRLLSADEVIQREESLIKARQESTERIRLERERAEAAAQAEKQRLIEEKAKRDNFEQLIRDITANMSSDNVDLVLELLSKAESIFPNDSRLPGLKQQIQEKLKQIEIERNLQAANQAEVEKNNRPLAERLAKVGKIQTAIGNVKSWLKNNSKDALSEQDMIELKDALTRIYNNLNARDQKKVSGYSNWKDLENHIDKAMAQSWYSEITGNTV